MSAPAIPPIKAVAPELTKILTPMKESIEQLRGRLPKQVKIKLLDAGSSDAQIIAKVNEILGLLQP